LGQRIAKTWASDVGAQAVFAEPVANRSHLGFEPMLYHEHGFFGCVVPERRFQMAVWPVHALLLPPDGLQSPKIGVM
jgi:hypothetical protein